MMSARSSCAGAAVVFWVLGGGLAAALRRRPAARDSRGAAPAATQCSERATIRVELSLSRRPHARQARSNASAPLSQNLRRALLLLSPLLPPHLDLVRVERHREEGTLVGQRRQRHGCCGAQRAKRLRRARKEMGSARHCREILRVVVAERGLDHGREGRVEVLMLLLRCAWGRRAVPNRRGRAKQNVECAKLFCPAHRALKRAQPACRSIRTHIERSLT